jgi:hypothetical protein
MRTGDPGKGAWRPVTVDVPFGVIGVLLRRFGGSSSAGSVSFSFIHTNDMPVSCRFLADFRRFSAFLFADKCFKRRTDV